MPISETLVIYTKRYSYVLTIRKGAVPGQFDGETLISPIVAAAGIAVGDPTPTVLAERLQLIQALSPEEVKGRCRSAITQMDGPIEREEPA